MKISINVSVLEATDMENITDPIWQYVIEILMDSSISVNGQDFLISSCGEHFPF